MCRIEKIIPTKDEFMELYFAAPELGRLYPGFFTWWVDAYREIENGRRIVYVSKNGDTITGFAVVKLGEINKICTMVIFPDYVGRGIGVRLFNYIADRYEKIKASVSEENVVEYRRIFEPKDLVLVRSELGKYRKGKTEYFFERK